MIITTDYWMTWSNSGSLTPEEKASIDEICKAVDAAIKNRLKRTLEQQTFTDLVLDAPDTPNIILSRYAPITIASMQVWSNPAAEGDILAFTDAHLLKPSKDYALDRDKIDPTLSTGELRRIGNMWGLSLRRRPNQLSYQTEPNYGSIKLTFEGGYAEIPADIVTAACMAVTQLVGNRKYGYQVGSESWNGYSYNIPGVGLLANGTLGSADIFGLLSPYINYADTIG